MLFRSDAMNWLNDHKQSDDNPRRCLHRSLRSLTQHHDITVDLEWTSPTNRVVVGYTEPCLTVLSARDNASGKYINLCDIECIPLQFLVAFVTTSDPKVFVESIPGMTTSIEGFVVKLNDGTMFKVKTDAYCALHHTKDSINNPRRLFECVVNEASDDLLSLFATDQTAIDLIHDMQERVAVIYNHMVSYVEKFYEDNKHLDRKD